MATVISDLRNNALKQLIQTQAGGPGNKPTEGHARTVLRSLFKQATAPSMEDRTRGFLGKLATAVGATEKAEAIAAPANTNSLRSKFIKQIYDTPLCETTLAKAALQIHFPETVKGCDYFFEKLTNFGMSLASLAIGVIQSVFTIFILLGNLFTGFTIDKVKEAMYAQSIQSITSFALFVINYLGTFSLWFRNNALVNLIEMPILHAAADDLTRK